jgi:hypothetical protein
MDALPAAGVVVEQEFLDGARVHLRYSDNCTAAWAKPSGWRAAFRPKASASASIVRVNCLHPFLPRLSGNGTD